MSQENMSERIEKLTIQALHEEFEKNKFTGKFITDQYRFLMGRVLTIIDSAIIEERQNKAVKDLIKSEIVKAISHISDIVSDGRPVEPTDEELVEQLAGSVSEDEALGLK